MKQSRSWLSNIVIFPLLCGVSIIMCLMLLGYYVDAKSPLSSPAPSDPVLALLAQQINQYEKELSQPAISPESKSEISAKIKYLEAQATQRAEYLKIQADVLKTKQVVVINLTQSPVTGKMKNEATPYNGRLTEFYAPKYREARFASAWLFQDDKTSLLFLAGYLADEPQQGVIYIENRLDNSIQKYKTPFKDGELKILLEKNLLFVESFQGRKYTLNIEKQAYVDERDNPIPVITATPLPAYPAPQ